MEDRYSSAFDEVRASDDFKARMVDRMRQLNEIEEPVARRAPVSVPRRVRKRTLTILIAAAILLIGGTALAIGLSAMIGTRDRAARAVASYQAVLEGHGVPETVELPVNSVPVPSAYITYSKFQADEAGKWLPDTIPDIDVTAQAGGLTVRFSELISLTEFDQLACYLIVEGEKPVPYALTEIRLSIDGGEPLKTKAEMEREQNRGYGSQPTPTPFEAWNMDDNDTNYLTFPLEGNPLRAGTTFTLTGKLNGEAFTLTYDFTEEKYEQLRQTQLQEVSAIGAVIDAIPDETIPVNVTGRGYLVEEIALADHFIYYVDTLDPAWPAGKDHPSAPYDTYDEGLWVAMDGMLYEDEFVSASDDENGVHHGIYRAYFPYDDGNLPRESLVSLVGVVFRIEWATGKVTGPKDQAEYEAWRKESMELSAPDYGTDYMAKVSAKADTFTVSEVIYFNGWAGYFGLVVETDEAVDKPLYGMDRQPVVTLNGVKLNNHTNYIQTPNDFMGGSDRDGKRVGFWLDVPALRLMPDTFDVTVSWNGSETTFTLHKSDFQAG
ncbi:MAG: hypothetical protein IJI97_04880, partial [Clostridia bacterium]|nr:hypothetical protein [Clostridia bacterium]